MARKHWIVVLGTLLSLVLLTVLVANIDWTTFWASVLRVSWSWVVVAGVVMACGTLLRALRWTIIAGSPFHHYRYFWHATSLGYLGNAIYPARAGEVLRMVSISRATALPMPNAMTSAIIDRVADLTMLGLSATLIAVIHGMNVVSRETLLGIAAIVGIPMVGIAFFVLKGKGVEALFVALTRRLPTHLGTRLAGWYRQIIGGLWPLRSRQRMSAVWGLNLVVFLLDFISIWIVFVAFGWSLPLSAAITVGVFISAGTSLPSAPAYVGIYQVACILALGLYGLDVTSAVAYAVVLQLLNLAVIGVLNASSLLDGRIAAVRKAQGASV